MNIIRITLVSQDGATWGDARVAVDMCTPSSESLEVGPLSAPISTHWAGFEVEVEVEAGADTDILAETLTARLSAAHINGAASELERIAELAATGDKTRDGALLAIEEYLERHGITRDWIGA